MQVTIFGANGKVGSLVVKKSLEKGFHVVAFSHGKTIFKTKHRLRVVQGDVYDIRDVDKAIKGSDIVISALGSWRSPNKDILTEGMKNIIPSMYRHKIKRIISLTGAEAVAEDDKNNYFHKLTHLLLSLIAKKILKDGENHIRLLKNSDLDWTVLRSPIINEKGYPTHFILTSKKLIPWSTINRNSVVQCLIEQISDHEYIQQSPYVKRTHV